MSCADDPKTLGKRIAFALWNRINAGALTRKHLQIDLGISEGTVDNLLSGNGNPSGPVIDALIAVLRAPFVNEVWGHHNIYCISRHDEKRAELLRKREEIEAELQRMEGK